MVFQRAALELEIVYTPLTPNSYYLESFLKLGAISRIGKANYHIIATARCYGEAFCPGIVTDPKWRSVDPAELLGSFLAFSIFKNECSQFRGQVLLQNRLGLIDEEGRRRLRNDYFPSEILVEPGNDRDSLIRLRRRDRQRHE